MILPVKSPKSSMRNRTSPPSVNTTNKPLRDIDGTIDHSIATSFWSKVDPDIRSQHARFGVALAGSGGVYRDASRSNALIVVEKGAETKSMFEGKDLGPLMIERMKVQVLNGGKIAGNRLSNRELEDMLKCESFLRQ